MADETPIPIMNADLQGKRLWVRVPVGWTLTAMTEDGETAELAVSALSGSVVAVRASARPDQAPEGGKTP